MNNAPRWLTLGPIATIAALFMLMGFYLMWFVFSDPSLGTAWLTVTFLYLLGLSQFGTVFVALLRLCFARWSVPYYHGAELLTLAGLPIAVIGFSLVFIFGRTHLFYWLDPASAGSDPWLTESGVVWRFVGSQGLFYLLALIGYQWGKKEGNTTRLYRLAVLQLIAFVIASTLLAWDFGMLLHHHWLSSIYPIHFFMSSVFGGLALILLIAIINNVPLSNRAIENYGRLLIGFSMLWLYFFWSQYIVFWFGNLSHEMAPIEQQMSGRYRLLYVLMLLCLFVIPFFGLLRFEMRSQKNNLLSIALLILIGVWLHRVLIILPVMNVDITLLGIFTSFSAAIMLTAGVCARARVPLVHR